MINGKNYANKYTKVKGNPKLAGSVMENFYFQYILGTKLIHPNIIQLKYFMSEYKKKCDTHYFNLIMELVVGQTLESYVQDSDGASNMDLA